MGPGGTIAGLSLPPAPDIDDSNHTRRWTATT